MALALWVAENTALDWDGSLGDAPRNEIARLPMGVFLTDDDREWEPGDDMSPDYGRFDLRFPDF